MVKNRYVRDAQYAYGKDQSYAVICIRTHVIVICFVHRSAHAVTAVNVPRRCISVFFFYVGGWAVEQVNRSKIVPV